ncbi:MAG: DUF2273 domain-containing protein [Oscillospiraceae bacterium]|jgi:uncharacterized membrane protein|nr:DUF2273 domain-containing protein [Oscillospiraceae bacterium]
MDFDKFDKIDKKEAFKPGTNLYALVCAVVGFAIALLALIIGFWKTLLLVAFFVVGWFIGKTGIVQKLTAYFAERYREPR